MTSSNSDKNIDLDEEVDFGFKKVTKEAKSRLVKDVFETVSDRYDLMNDLMSLGIHRAWKNQLVNKLYLRKEMKILDLACGTGDVSLRIVKKAEKKNININLFSADLTPSMLLKGKNNLINNGYIDHANMINADAMSLPIKSESLDAYLIAFGIRNFADTTKALEEAYRVLKPGGQFLCLEFSNVSPFIEKIYDLYSFTILPRLGKIVSGSSEPYQYLVESIKKFSDQHNFVESCKKAKFSKPNYRSLTGGIASIYSAWRL